MLKIRTHKYRVILLVASCFARFAKSSPFFAKYLSRVADRKMNVYVEGSESQGGRTSNVNAGPVENAWKSTGGCTVRAKMGRSTLRVLAGIGGSLVLKTGYPDGV
jgi:hypothetical protein